MLTKQDLNNISQVVSTAIQTQVPPLINSAIQTQVPLFIKKETDPLKRSLVKLEKNTKYIINDLDKILMHTVKRVDRIEKELKLPSFV
jgi:hypothetical protein